MDNRENYYNAKYNVAKAWKDWCGITDYLSIRKYEPIQLYLEIKEHFIELGIENIDMKNVNKEIVKISSVCEKQNDDLENTPIISSLTAAMLDCLIISIEDTELYIPDRFYKLIDHYYKTGIAKQQEISDQSEREFALTETMIWVHIIYRDFICSEKERNSLIEFSIDKFRNYDKTLDILPFFTDEDRASREERATKFKQDRAFDPSYSYEDNYRGWIMNGFSKYSEEDQKFAIYRFGLFQERIHTLQETCKHFSISYKQGRKKESIFLHHLFKSTCPPQRRKKLSDFLD